MLSPNKIMTDSTPIPSIHILAQRSAGLLHTEVFATCPLYVHHNGSIKEIIFNVTDVPAPAMLGCKTCEEFELVKFNCSLETSKEDKSTHPEEHTPYKSQQRTNEDRSRPDTQKCPPLDKMNLFNKFGD